MCFLFYIVDIRAQFSKIIRYGIGTLRCIWNNRCSYSTFNKTSIFGIRNVDLCSIVCITIHHFYGFCYSHRNYDLYWFRYHRRSVDWILLLSFFFFWLALDVFPLYCNEIWISFSLFLGTLITIASALLFGFLGAVIIFFLLFGFVLLAGYFGLVQIYELIGYPNKRRANIDYIRGNHSS